MNKLVIATNEDDWEGLYAEGVLVSEGHRLDRWYIIDMVHRFNEIPSRRVVDSDWLVGEGRLPNNIDEVRWAE